MSLLNGINAWAKPKSNYAATSAPAVTDDAAAGYAVGSVWIDLVTDTVYVCTDSKTGEAVWAYQGSATIPDVIAAAVLTDHALVRGDGGVRGVQTTGWICADTTNALSLAGLEMRLNPASGFGLTLTQTLKTAATPAPLLTLTGAAHTAVTASAEAVDVSVNLARVVQWATGALATQRAILITAPTYAFVGASTLTSAATVYIDGAPVAGTNATLTNTAALWIALANSSGASNLANVGLRFSDTLNAVRTGAFIQATACALATGAMIDLTPGAATVAAIRTRGGKIDLSITGNSADAIISASAGQLSLYAGNVQTLQLNAGSVICGISFFANGGLATSAGNLLLSPVAGSYVAFGTYVVGVQVSTGYIVMAAADGTPYRVPVLAHT